jgi:hypothetical protein
MNTILRAAVIASALFLTVQVKQVHAQLLSEAARNAIGERLLEVKAKIEAIEDEMYKLAEEHDVLVTSRDRWYSEMDRVQTEARNAERELVESEVRAKEMRERTAALTAKATKQLEEDEQLKALRMRRDTYKKRQSALVEDKAKSSVIESVEGQIFDAEIEIAQREESLRISYTGGQALDLHRRLIELESEMVVRAAVKKTHDDRLAQLKSLSPHVTAYLRLARQVEELQILHRRLADLNAQQQIEVLRALGVATPKVIAAAKK